jgi:hypothetical protein
MGFDHSHYVPILKGKQGEFDALANITSGEHLQRFTPLIEVPQISVIYPDPKSAPVPSKTIDEHVADVAESLIEAIKNLPSVFIDGFYIETEDDLQDGSSPIDYLFRSLREAGVPFISVIGLDRVEDYANSVSDAMSIDKRGCCLRLVEADIDGIAELEGQIAALFKTISTEPSEVDLLVDFGPKVPPKATLPFLIDSLPLIGEWRSFTIACSSFPANMSDVKKNSIKELSREEWEAWLSIRSKSSVKRMPTYGDYGINHPVLSEDYNPFTMNMSPNIRYTDTLNYVLAKGQAQPRKKWANTPQKLEIRAQLAPGVQYPKLATAIKKHSAWKGTAFSWGDGFIDRCSRKECAGSATDWRAVGMSHHIALVLQQIANLP